MTRWERWTLVIALTAIWALMIALHAPEIPLAWERMTDVFRFGIAAWRE
jgi:hypothetical protein